MSQAGRLLVLSGPSGAGKSTLSTKLRERFPGLAYSVSLTTRSPRAGESNGVDYHFVTRKDFEARVEAGEMAEWAEVFGNLYGTSAKVVADTLAKGQDLLLEIDVDGAAQLRPRFPQGIFIFILPPSDEELERRLRGRGTEDEEVVQRRLARAQAELAQASKYDHQIVNDDLESALARLVAIVEESRG